MNIHFNSQELSSPIPTLSFFEKSKIPADRLLNFLDSLIKKFKSSCIFIFRDKRNLPDNIGLMLIIDPICTALTGITFKEFIWGLPITSPLKDHPFG